MLIKLRAALSAALCLWAASPAEAQPPAQAVDVEGVVVTARRIGVPVWRVGDDASTLILVGRIHAVPKGTKWRPEELSKVVAEADSVVFPHSGRASPADIGRALWRARSIVFLPKGKTLTDYTRPETRARLEALKTRGVIDDYLKFHPWGTAQELLDSIGAEKNSGPDLEDVVSRAVRQHRKQKEAVAVVTGRQMLDAYFNEGPAPHVPCLEAALDAAEAGPDGPARRIEAYIRYRVAEVIRSPVERAFQACWPEGGEPTSSVLRTDWRAKIQSRVGRPGITLAVVPLTYLAEPGGVLDTLEAQGRSVEGPRWKD